MQRELQLGRKLLAVVGKQRFNHLLRTGALALLLAGTGRQQAAAQAGKSGVGTIATTNAIVNEYTALTANATTGATTITVASSLLNANNRFAAPLAAGDLLLLVQPQGAAISTADDATYGTVTALNNAGRYQLVEVAAVPTATTIALSCKLFSSYTTAGHAQVVRVPRYTTLTVNTNISVKAQAWNGTTGGVLAIEATGDVTLATGATLDVSALGFRGGALEQNTDAAPNNDLGYRSTASTYAAEKGESIAGTIAEYDALNGRYGRGAPANGGGGGNSHNAAGGGGANVAVAGATYTGTGNPDRGAGNAYDAAWNLEAANFATSISSGGGRGGYSYSSTNQDALTLATGQAAWGGDNRQNKGGFGGHPMVSSGRAFFGGGGGAGDSNNNSGTAGAAGGGFIYLVAGGAVTGGSLLADGGSVTVVSNNDGAGGGGGGGSVVVNSTNLTTTSLLVRGGKGGSQSALAAEAEGAGGGGGGGLVSYTNGAPTTDVSGGLNGTTLSGSLTEFPPNGGTRGGAGRADAGACSVALCQSVADVATSISFGTNPLPANQQAVINVTFINNGPDAADNVTRFVQLPAGLGAGAVTVTTSTGSGSYDNATGQVTFTAVTTLANGANANATINYTPSVAGTVAITSTISTTTSEACQLDDDNSGTNNLVVIYPADLNVTLSGPSTVAAASAVTYTAIVQNITPSGGSGTADATSTVLTVQLAKALLITDFPAGTTYNFDTGIATLAIGQVNRGTSQSFAFTFTLPNNNQSVAGVASATAFEPDPDATNNNGVASTMRVATTVTMPAGTGTCAGTTYDGTTATQGLYAEYFKGYFNDVLTFFDSPKVADMKRSEGSVNYTASNAWGDLSAAFGSGSVTNPDQYSVRYRGYLTITTAGSYTFTLYSDDASYLWLDNSARATPLVAANAAVNDGNLHGPKSVTSVAITMGAGAHPLLALYGENTGGNVFRISYSGPDTGNATVVIPTSAMCNRQFSGPLPVTLTAFTAKAESRAARLNWNTATELHNDHFDLERSRDGVTFQKLAEVKGAGSSTISHDYSYLDANAAEMGGGKVYYRLRQVDLDGTSEYSPVRTVAFGVGAAGFVLFPNPAQQRVGLQLSLATAGTISLTDLAGRVVMQQTIEAGATQPSLDLSTVATGIYVVQVVQNGQRFTQKLVHTGN
ncbi:T9SS type A sorting domain-containing protein [Hymenobacter siberiensis]|uniref:T9SS type A sorting domain-containing protein n=1 Tax=Hymenobacter siberiensis TaxID=2848396 RepID=UPI001C1E6013|nr:T9SS type A sorting domain-containing protein [Hymenobacter siberiensis]MBU6122933.1 T9SS type A sorting domain-containing protein [Hymenobacter siberiensis]